MFFLWISDERLLWESRLSAANAALQPLPAAVIPCRHSCSATSPAAKSPSTEVSGLPESVLI
mgnify:CR=1 FL=1